MMPTIRGAAIDASDVDTHTAMEMARVGIVPSEQGPEEEPVGYKFTLAGQQFTVTGYVDRATFLSAVKREGLPLHIFMQCPEHYYFQSISTD